MLKPYSMLLLLGLAGGVGFNAVAAPKLITVGEGSYRFMLWQLYDARLATANGKFENYQQSTPVLLELSYKRDITRQQFIKATVDEWQKLGLSTKTQQQQWAQRLQNLWQDVKKGDSLSALLHVDGRVTFYLNGAETGRLEDTAFGPAFFDIWLHPDTSAPKLRRQLIAAQ